jgi:hypothetical protein
VLFPGMTHRLDFSSDHAASGISAIVLETINLLIENPAHMPMTGDLRTTGRTMIHAWLKNGCSEGGSDA